MLVVNVALLSLLGRSQSLVGFNLCVRATSRAACSAAFWYPLSSAALSQPPVAADEPSTKDWAFVLAEDSASAAAEQGRMCRSIPGQPVGSTVHRVLLTSLARGSAETS